MTTMLSFLVHHQKGPINGTFYRTNHRGAFQFNLNSLPTSIEMGTAEHRKLNSLITKPSQWTAGNASDSGE